jgi:hypothetical protein
MIFKKERWIEAIGAKAPISQTHQHANLDFYVSVPNINSHGVKRYYSILSSMCIFRLIKSQNLSYIGQIRCKLFNGYIKQFPQPENV